MNKLRRRKQRARRIKQLRQAFWDMLGLAVMEENERTTSY